MDVKLLYRHVTALQFLEKVRIFSRSQIALGLRRARWMYPLGTATILYHQRVGTSRPDCITRRVDAQIVQTSAVRKAKNLFTADALLARIPKLRRFSRRSAKPNTKSRFWSKKNLNFEAKIKIWGFWMLAISNF